MRNNISETNLLVDLVKLIESGKKEIAYSANATITMTYWNIGKRINQDVLSNERAGYGKKIVAEVSNHLILKYGKSFEEKNLRRMMQFASVFNEEKIVATMWRQLSWSHFKHEQIELLQIEKSGIKVSEYLTELPKKELLEEKLQNAIEQNRMKSNNRQ